MPTLHETQRRFFSLITAPENVERTLTTRGLSPAHVDEMVVGDARRSSLGRLDIYANMYFFRLHEILQQENPALASALGEDRFHNLVTDYLQAHPSADPSVRRLGRHLAAFVAVREPAWLGELARLEAARLDCFDAAEREPLDLDQVRGLQPDQLVTLPLELVPAHARLRCQFAVDEAWAQSESGEPVVMPAESPRTLIVWRREVSVFHRVCDADEAELLGVQHLGLLCERLASSLAPEDAAARAFQLLARWLSDGLLSGVKI